MSDYLTPEDLEAIKARDARFRVLELGIEVETALRDGRALDVLMTRLRADADRAMAEFATTNPADVPAITNLQARVFRFTYLLDTLNGILAEGQHAEAAIVAEDGAEREREY